MSQVRHRRLLILRTGIHVLNKIVFSLSYIFRNEIFQVIESQLEKLQDLASQVTVFCGVILQIQGIQDHQGAVVQTHHAHLLEVGPIFVN